MNIVNTGGPAFPVTLHNNTDEAFLGWEDEELKPGVMANYKGLSVRDWFAGQALTGILMIAEGKKDKVFSREEAATIAYAMADAMLKAREGS